MSISKSESHGHVKRTKASLRQETPQSQQKGLAKRAKNRKNRKRNQR